MTLPIVILFLSIVLGVLSGLGIFRSYRRTLAALKREQAINREWTEAHDRLYKRLDESLFERQKQRALLTAVGIRHKRATELVANGKRNSKFWRTLFMDVSTGLAERNKEVESLTAENARLEKDRQAFESLYQDAEKHCGELINQRDQLNAKLAKLLKAAPLRKGYKVAKKSLGW